MFLIGAAGLNILFETFSLFLISGVYLLSTFNSLLVLSFVRMRFLRGRTLLDIRGCQETVDIVFYSIDIPSNGALYCQISV